MFKWDFRFTLWVKVSKTMQDINYIINIFLFKLLLVWRFRLLESVSFWMIPSKKYFYHTITISLINIWFHSVVIHLFNFHFFVVRMIVVQIDFLFWKFLFILLFFFHLKMYHLFGNSSNKRKMKEGLLHTTHSVVFYHTTEKYGIIIINVVFFSVNNNNVYTVGWNIILKLYVSLLVF